jgi:phosphatidylethanolamine/phosphatidyl-N-methylethanolamine N-methyltransferase
MGRRIDFFIEFAKAPLKVGAIIPSSRYLRRRMLSSIPFNDDIVIVEYGPGNGVFTDYIASTLTPNSTFIVVENNPSFYKNLQEKYKSYPNVHIELGSVENIKEILSIKGIEHADYVISGIPFLSLGAEFTHTVFSATKGILKPSSQFILFQYTRVLESILVQHFPRYQTSKVLINFPPAIVFKAQA